MSTDRQPEIPPGLTEKKLTNRFRRALLRTAVPIVILSLIGMAGMAGGEAGGMVLGFAWWFGAVYFLGALIAFIVFAIKQDKTLVAGVLAGLAIGLVSLGATCFAGNALSSSLWF
jgi:hypothetical protein